MYICLCNMLVVSRGKVNKEEIVERDRGRDRDRDRKQPEEERHA